MVYDIKEKIEELIMLKREGGYWDFKEKWHENKVELLLDIICMANNQEDRDAYIILGVEDVSMKINGIEKDSNRLSLNDLSQYLYSQPFAGCVPEIDLQTIELNEHEVDVIIVKNTNHTPYYLEKNCRYRDKEIKCGNIYIRLNDRKAGVDKAAPYSCIEHLWRKRFGIECSIIERLSIRLDEFDEWDCNWDNRNYAYHKSFPEFQLVRDVEMENGWHPVAAFYTNPEMHYAKLNIKYHSTTIYETELWALDEYRKILPKPRDTIVQLEEDSWYSYYELDTIEGKLLRIFTQDSLNIASREPFYNQILIFNNRAERNKFEVFLKAHSKEISNETIEQKYCLQIEQDNPKNGGGLFYSARHIAKMAELYSLWKKRNKSLY